MKSLTKSFLNQRTSLSLFNCVNSRYGLTTDEKNDKKSSSIELIDKKNTLNNVKKSKSQSVEPKKQITITREPGLSDEKNVFDVLKTSFKNLSNFFNKKKLKYLYINR